MRKCMLYAMILLISVWIVGCADSIEENNEADQAPKENEEVIEDGNNGENKIDNKDNEAGEVQTIEGSFTGWIDNNSFEIMSNDEPFVIRTNPDVTMPEESLEGKMVRIDYTTNEQGQNIIQNIEVIE